MNREGKSNKEKRDVFVYASVDVVNLYKKCMSHTLQRTNEQIVFIISKTTALAYAMLCDRRDVEMLLFYFPLSSVVFGISFLSLFFVIF